MGEKICRRHRVSLNRDLPAPLKGRRVGKLEETVQSSRLARRERFCMQGRIKGLENLPGTSLASSMSATRARCYPIIKKVTRRLLHE